MLINRYCMINEEEKFVEKLNKYGKLNITRPDRLEYIRDLRH